MDIERINCLIAMRQNPAMDHPSTTVPKMGQEAVPATEVPILQALYGLECIEQAHPSGEKIEGTTKREEFDRLVEKYGDERVKMAYPTPAVPMPTRMVDLELDATQIATPTQMLGEPAPAPAKGKAA